jgi:hypothetical protein
MKKIIPIFLFLIFISLSFSQNYYQKITSGPLVTDLSYGSGCAWGDYNNDGKLDLIVTAYNDYGSSGYPLLYQNIGNGNFLKITNSPIVNNSFENTLACVWGDYNHDCKLDLFISTGSNQPDLLYKNLGGGNFERITTGSIVNTNGHSGGCCWTDYNRDGYLDLLVVQHGNNLLYKGNPDGTFTQITTGPIVTDMGTHRRAAWGDYNNDHYPDLFVCNFNNENDNLYLNNKNGTFTKITSGDIVNSGGYGSGCAWGDYNNDGWLDLIVTNGGYQNFLYKNNKNGTFTKITSGPVVTDIGAGFGCNWGDVDNDGDLDLFVANNYNQVNFLYRNDGGDVFTKITNEPVVTDAGSSVGSTFGDYNNDGKLDLFVVNQGYGGPAENDCLYKNIKAVPFYLIIKVYGGIGTRVKLRIGDRTQIREVSGGNGCSSQDMLWLHFGLGYLAGLDNPSVDSVIVDWNDGYRQIATDVEINQELEFRGTVGVNNTGTELPNEYSLMQNYPNPFNPSTTILYSLPQKSNVKLIVYDVFGKEVMTLVNDIQPAGEHTIMFDGSNLSSGIYFYKLSTERFTETKKMILVK